MKAGGGGVPTGKIFELIVSSFGSYETFRAEFENAGNTAFGSGWAWLVHTSSGLKVLKTSNADTPVTDEGVVPLLTMVRIIFSYFANCLFTTIFVIRMFGNMPTTWTIRMSAQTMSLLSWTT